MGAWPVQPLLMKAARVFLSISQDNIRRKPVLIHVDHHMNIMENIIYGIDIAIVDFKCTIIQQISFTIK